MDSTRFLPSLFAAVAAVGCAALLPLAAEPVPGPLVPAGETPRLQLAARGVQIYECRRVDGVQAAWLFIAPEARLSTTAASRPDAMAPARPGRRRTAAGSSAPWSRRSFRGTTTTRSPGCCCTPAPPTAPGRLAGITSVQRIHTSGGTSPARNCSEATLGRVARVPYTADYVFFEGGQS